MSTIRTAVFTGRAKRTRPASLAQAKQLVVDRTAPCAAASPSMHTVAAVTSHPAVTVAAVDRPALPLPVATAREIFPPARPADRPALPLPAASVRERFTGAVTATPAACPNPPPAARPALPPPSMTARESFPGAVATKRHVQPAHSPQKRPVLFTPFTTAPPARHSEAVAATHPEDAPLPTKTQRCPHRRLSLAAALATTPSSPRDAPIAGDLTLAERANFAGEDSTYPAPLAHLFAVVWTTRTAPLPTFRAPPPKLHTAPVAASQQAETPP